jgi:hypothetical protein
VSYEEAKRKLAADLSEMRRFAGPNPDPLYMADLLLKCFREGRYDYDSQPAREYPAPAIPGPVTEEEEG